MDINIMLVMPGSVSDTDAAKMEAAGVLCIECQDPSKARLMVGESLLTNSEMLWAASVAILDCGYDQVRELFGKAVAKSLLAKRPLPPKP